MTDEATRILALEDDVAALELADAMDRFARAQRQQLRGEEPRAWSYTGQLTYGLA